MRRRLGRSVLIGGLAAGAVLASEVGGALGADLNTFLSTYSSFPPQIVGADGRLTSTTAQPFLGFFQQDNTSLSESSSSSFNAGILSVKADAAFRDTERTDGKSYGGSFVGNGLEWQKNQVAYTNSQMDLGDIFRLKTRFGASTYDASDEFFNSLGRKKTPEAWRALRFASRAGPASGAAALTRAEEDILRLGDAKVTLFQEFAQVNSLFEDVKFSDKALRKQTKEDVFSAPDRQTYQNGVSLVQGSSGVMFSQSSISDLSGTASGFYREQRFNSKAWLGLRDIANGFSNSTGSVLGNLVPSSVWVGYSEAGVRQNVGASALTGGATNIAALPVGISSAAITDVGTITDATIRNVDAGLSWQWGHAYASVGAWRSQQVSSSSTLSLADGADVSFGVSEKKWSANAYMSLARWSSSQDIANYTGNYSVDGGASFSVLLENWPTVTLSFDMSNYNGVYTAWDAKESGRTLSAGIGFDFSKYLNERSRQKLKLFYFARDYEYTGQWGAFNSSSSNIEHVFGTTFRTAL